MANVRHEEDKMMALTKSALLKAVQAAKTRQIIGFENLPLLSNGSPARVGRAEVGNKSTGEESPILGEAPP